MTREEKILETRRLRRLGVKSTEVARRLGVSDSTVRNWWLGGECEVCGAPLNGSDALKPTRCLEHVEHPPPDWPQERVIAAIQNFVRLHDFVPRETDLLHQDGSSFPCFSTVVRRFGTFAKGIEAAGFEPRKQVGYKKWTTPQAREVA